MPDKLDRCVDKVKGEGKSEDSAYAICNSTIEEIMIKQVIEAKLNGTCKCQKKKHS